MLLLEDRQGCCLRGTGMGIHKTPCSDLIHEGLGLKGFPVDVTLGSKVMGDHS